MSGRILVYGATGYAGRLLLRRAVAQGLVPLGAGRDPQAVHRVADELAVDSRTADLADPAALARALHGVAVLVNCAGPFRATQQPLVDACLAAGVHYLDLAGEVPELLAVQGRDAAAREAGIMLLPGAGFGVVPTDCLAAHVAARLPAATRLEIAYETVGGASRGTLGTVLPQLHRPGVRRHDGALVTRSPAAGQLRIDLGGGVRTAVTNPHRGDLVTAFSSTRVGDIETFTVFGAPLVAVMRAGRLAAPLLDSRGWQWALRRLLARLPDGPDDEALAAGSARVWARVTDASGTQAVSTARTSSCTAAVCRAPTGTHDLVRYTILGPSRSGRRWVAYFTRRAEHPLVVSRAGSAWWETRTWRIKVMGSPEGRGPRSSDVFGLLWLMVHRTSRDAAAVLEREGLNPAKFQLLLAVRDAPGAAQRELGERSGMTGGNVSMVVSRLVGSGLLRREPRGAANRVWLTEVGQQLVDRLAPGRLRSASSASVR